MGTPAAVILATVHRLGARLGHGLADVAAELAIFAQDAPDRIRQEWDLFQEEVMAEAERLERDQSPDSSSTSAYTASTSVSSTPFSSRKAASQSSPQELIDRLRAEVADLSGQLEGRS